MAHTSSPLPGMAMWGDGSPAASDPRRDCPASHSERKNRSLASGLASERGLSRPDSAQRNLGIETEKNTL